jgi:hypothetical protein
MPRKKPHFTVEPGRQIYRDGVPFISIGREGRTMPASADEVTHAIAECLNQLGWLGHYERSSYGKSR